MNGGATGVAYVARGLDEVPAVTRLLTRLGLGDLPPDEVSGAVGRNDNWVGTTTGGADVFIKRVHGVEPERSLRIRRLMRFEQFVRAGNPTSAPRCLGWDESAGVFVHRRVPDAVSGSVLMIREQFTPDLARRTAEILAGLHSSTLEPRPELDDPVTLLPSSRLMEGLPLPLFERCSAAQLQAWSLMQKDGELCEAVGALETASAAARPSPAHCDLRVDQILVDGSGTVLLTDWEEFRLADPARDTGGFVGEWLYRAVLDVPTTRGDDPSAPATVTELDERTIVTRGIAKLERLRPLITAFWSAYTEARPVDRDMAARTAAYAGWHLLDRLLAGAMNVSRLQPIQRAAAGIGRRVLIAPDRAVPALGLGAPLAGGPGK